LILEKNSNEPPDKEKLMQKFAGIHPLFAVAPTTYFYKFSSPLYESKIQAYAKDHSLFMVQY
jgi:hypothetical protein